MPYLCSNACDSEVYKVHCLFHQNTILKRIYKFCDKAFIEKRSPYTIRKTFTSMLVNKGIMDVSEVSEILGHVDEQTLINHYLYLTKIANTRLEMIAITNIVVTVDLVPTIFMMI